MQESPRSYGTPILVILIIIGFVVANHYYDGDEMSLDEKIDAILELEDKKWAQQHPLDEYPQDHVADPGADRYDSEDGERSPSDYDCDDFRTQAEAQDFMEYEGGDPYWLDGDNDGIACELLP